MHEPFPFCFVFSFHYSDPKTTVKQGHRLTGACRKISRFSRKSADSQKFPNIRFVNLPVPQNCEIFLSWKFPFYSFTGTCNSLLISSATCLFFFFFFLFPEPLSPCFAKATRSTNGNVFYQYYNTMYWWWYDSCFFEPHVVCYVSNENKYCTHKFPKQHEMLYELFAYDRFIYGKHLKIVKEYQSLVTQIETRNINNCLPRHIASGSTFIFLFFYHCKINVKCWKMQIAKFMNEIKTEMCILCASRCVNFCPMS